MTAAEACVKLVDELPSTLVESLIIQLRGCAPPVFSNPSYQAKVDEFLGQLSFLRIALVGMRA